MKMREMKVWSFVLLVALGTCGVLGCSEDEPEKKIAIGDDEPAEKQGPRFGLKWGEFRDHPAYTAVERCHELDTVELNLLRYVIGGEDIDADEVAPIFGDEIDKEADEFEKKRQREAVAAKLSAKLDELRGKPLCVRHQIVVGEYDFDAEGFQLPEDAIMVLHDDLTASAEQAISRLETKTTTRRPEGFAMPSVLALAPSPAILSVPEDNAETILEQLPKTESDKDEQESGDKPRQANRFNSVVSRMEPEAFEAAIYAEDHVPDDKEDRPVGEVFTQIQDKLEELASGRKSNGVLVFGPVEFDTNSIREEGVDIPMKFTVGKLTHLVATTPNGEVFGVAPDFSDEESKREGTRVDINRDLHDPLLEKVCRGGVRTHVDTRLRDGELVDIRTPRCRHCPPGASEKWGHAPLEDISWGSFTHPGAIEAVVRTRGCEPMVNGGGGITLLEKLAEGTWRRVKYTAGEFGSPQIVRNTEGRDIIISRSEQANGGVASGSIVATTLSAEEASTQALFPIYDNRGTCDEDYLIIEPGETTHPDLNDDGVLDVVFEVTLHHGTRSGSRCDFGDNDGVGKGETLELSFEVNEDGLALADQSKKTHAKLERAVEGGQ